MVTKTLFKSGIRILLHNPVLIKSLFSGNFDKIYCSYWHSKLNAAEEFYQEVMNNETKNTNFLDKIKNVNSEILNTPSSRIEAFFIPLYILIRKLKPNVVIETGVHRGVSSFFILQALEKNGNGMLYSIDLPFASYETDNKSFSKSVLPKEKIGICVPEKLRKRWKLILGDSKNELPDIIKNNSSIDLFLHDSEHTHTHMMWEFETVWPHIKNGGVLVSDDIHWNNAFESFVTKIDGTSIQLKRDRENAGTFGIILKI